MRQWFGDEPPLKKPRTWAECFDGDLSLYFEAHLPSPSSYKPYLRQNPPEHNLIPYVLLGGFLVRVNNRDFEGATHVDALLLNPRNGFALLVEAKVLSDISYHVSFDVTWNQIARTVDVMLDSNSSLTPPLAIAIRKILYCSNGSFGVTIERVCSSQDIRRLLSEARADPRLMSGTMTSSRFKVRDIR